MPTYLSSSVRWPKAGDDRVTAMPARISSTLRMRVPARSDMTKDWRQDGKVPARREKGIIKAFRALWLFLEVEKSGRLALGMAMTSSRESSHARAACEGVMPWRRVNATSFGLESRRACSIGEYAIT